jgi:hypothetical protein
VKHLHSYRVFIDYGHGENLITSGTDLDYINKVYHMQRSYNRSNAIIIMYKDRHYLKSSFGKGK